MHLSARPCHLGQEIRRLEAWHSSWWQTDPPLACAKLGRFDERPAGAETVLSE